jgi:hypothetical protein
VLGKRGTEAAYRRRTEAGSGAPRDGNGVPVAGVPEGSGEVARQLLRDDVVLVVCLAGTRRQWIAGTTARPSGGGSSSSQALWSGRSGARERNWAGWGAPVGGRATSKHWMGDGQRQRWLSTTSSSCGGGPARWRAREKEK